MATTIPAKPAVPVFSDANNPWTNCDQHACTGAHAGRYQPGWYSVNPPKTGTTMQVQGFQGNGTVKVRVNW